MLYFEYYLLVILLIPGIILGIIAEFKVQINYNKYKKVLSKKGYTGSQVARAILDSAGLYDYKIQKISGNLTDHFNPKTKTVSLSEDVYNGTSVASLGIASHEVGHALQYAENYTPIKVRNFMITVSNISSKLLLPLIIMGLLFSFLLYIEPFGTILLYAGVGIFGLSVLINLVTLPVEYNASNRAKKILINSEICDEEEMVGVNKVLNSAALTYVASLVVSILNLIRIILIFRRDD